MSLSTAELLRVARLARLRIDEEDAGAHAAQLTGILEHFAGDETLWCMSRVRCLS